MAIDHILVRAGDSWYGLAKRLAPVGSTNQQLQTFAIALATTNGTTVAAPLYVGRVLHLDTATIPVVAPVPGPTGPGPTGPGPTGPGPTGPPTSVLTDKLVPTDPTKMLVGVSVEGGRKGKHITHTYARGISSFLTPAEVVAAAGTIPFVNVKPAGLMGPAEYQTILSGGRDAVLTQIAARIVAYGKPMYVAPLHEPEDDDKTGASDAEYAKAWRYIVTFLRDRGAKFVAVWNVMSFGNWIPRYDTLYPGDDLVDIIAGDPYSANSSDTLAKFASVPAFYTWASKHGKPIFYAEFGKNKTDAASGPKWLSTANLNEVQQIQPLVRGWLYWDNATTTNDYRINNLPAGTWEAFIANEQFNVVIPPSYLA